MQSQLLWRPQRCWRRLGVCRPQPQKPGPGCPPGLCSCRPRGLLGGPGEGAESRQSSAFDCNQGRRKTSFPALDDATAALEDPSPVHRVSRAPQGFGNAAWYDVHRRTLQHGFAACERWQRPAKTTAGRGVNGSDTLGEKRGAADILCMTSVQSILLTGFQLFCKAPLSAVPAPADDTLLLRPTNSRCKRR